MSELAKGVESNSTVEDLVSSIDGAIEEIQKSMNPKDENLGKSVDEDRIPGKSLDSLEDSEEEDSKKKKKKGKEETDKEEEVEMEKEDVIKSDSFESSITTELAKGIIDNQKSQQDLTKSVASLASRVKELQESVDVLKKSNLTLLEINKAQVEPTQGVKHAEFNDNFVDMAKSEFDGLVSKSVQEGNISSVDALMLRGRFNSGTYGKGDSLEQKFLKGGSK